MKWRETGPGSEAVNPRSRAARLDGGTQRSAIGLLLASAVALGAAIAVTGPLLIENLYHRTVADATQALDSLAVLLAAQADRAMGGIDLVQTHLIDEMKRHGIASADTFALRMSGPMVQDDLHALVARLPQVHAMLLLDSHGRLINCASNAPSAEACLPARSAFQTLAADPARQIVIRGRAADDAAPGGAPYGGTPSGETMSVTRAFRGPDGALLGAVQSAVEPGYFTNLYAEISPAAGAVISLFQPDGVPIYSFPPRPASLERAYTLAAAAGLASERLFQGGRTFQGRLRPEGPAGGQDLLAAGRQLPHDWLAVGISRDMSDVLAPWRRQALILGIGTVLLELALAAGAILAASLLRARGRLARAQQAGHPARALQLDHDPRGQTDMFTSTLDIMTEGVCLFDAADRLVVVNRRLAEIVGVGEPPSPGTSLAGCLAGMAVAGKMRALSLRPAELRLAAGALRRLRAARQPARLLWHLADGRVLSVHFQPIEGAGWLLTCHDATEQHAVTSRLAFLAQHDALTRLPNRTLFQERLHQAMRLARPGKSYAVMCLDVAGFREVNNISGHGAGDRLLQGVASRLASCVREGDMVARLGGNAFAVLQTVFDPALDPPRLAARILERLGRPFEIDGQTAIVSTSIGVAVSPHHGVEADLLLCHADTAMCQAKAEGAAFGGGFRVFESGMNASLEARRGLQADLHRALPGQEFEVHYQPLIEVATRRVVGFEALLRWRHPSRGMVQPSAFISLAEETGLIVAIGEWVLARACAEAATWPAGLKLAVNLSPAQFRSPTLMQAVIAALAQSGLSPDRLELEITETVLLSDTAETLAALHGFRALGLAMSLDDFGTGYSSLSYLRRFPFDKIKIDRSFVGDLGRRREGAAIVRTVAGLCRDLAMVMLAEGVETEDQFAALERAGCTEAQGLLFSPAVPASAIPCLLARLGCAVPEPAA